jgi:hypothetical protein
MAATRAVTTPSEEIPHDQSVRQRIAEMVRWDARAAVAGWRA